MQHSISSHEQIAKRAYEIWRDRGEPFGTPDQDWFDAEQQLAQDNKGLTEIAREVGSAIGNVVALFTSSKPSMAEEEIEQND